MLSLEIALAITRALALKRPEFVTCLRRQPMVDDTFLMHFVYYDESKQQEYEACLGCGYLEAWKPKDVAEYVYRLLSEDVKWNRGRDIYAKAPDASVPSKRWRSKTA